MQHFTRVTHQFDPASPTGILVCSHEPNALIGFSENGFDAVDYDRPPVVFEVRPKSVAMADNAIVINVARQVTEFWMSYEEYDMAVAQGTAVRARPGDEQFLCLEDNSLLNLIERADVRSALEDRGYFGASVTMPVSNREIDALVLWNPDFYELDGPLSFEFQEDEPHRILSVGTGAVPLRP